MRQYQPDWGKTRSNPAAPRSPLRTLAEMAEELGVTMTHLRSVVGGDKTAPKPIFLKSGNLKAKYSQVEMRKWWAARSTNTTS